MVRAWKSKHGNRSFSLFAIKRKTPRRPEGALVNTLFVFRCVSELMSPKGRNRKNDAIPSSGRNAKKQMKPRMNYVSNLLRAKRSNNRDSPPDGHKSLSSKCCFLLWDLLIELRPHGGMSIKKSGSGPLFLIT